MNRLIQLRVYLYAFRVFFRTLYAPHFKLSYCQALAFL